MRHIGKFIMGSFLVLLSNQLQAEDGKLPPVGQRVYEVPREGGVAKIHGGDKKSGFRDPDLSRSKVAKEEPAHVEVVTKPEPPKIVVKKVQKTRVQGRVQRPQVAFEDTAPAPVAPVDDNFNQDFMDRSYRVIEDRGF